MLVVIDVVDVLKTVSILFKDNRVKFHYNELKIRSACILKCM